MINGGVLMMDLHVHSSVSDGSFCSEDLILYAQIHGITTLAIADHETIIHYNEYSQFADHFNITLIPAIEINVSDCKNLHILGYYIENRAQLEETILKIRKKNQEICYNVLESLKKEFGISLNPLETVSYSPDRILDKKAITKAILNQGYATNVKDVYDKYIGPGAKSYIPIEKMTAQKVIQLIHDNKGVAVWAHPYTISRADGSSIIGAEFDQMAKKLIDYGIDGVEVFTSKHSKEQTSYLASLAKRNNLVVTGGSDFHSEDVHQIGCPELTQKHIEKLQLKARRYNRLFNFQLQNRSRG